MLTITMMMMMRRRRRRNSSKMMMMSEPKEGLVSAGAVMVLWVAMGNL